MQLVQLNHCDGVYSNYWNTLLRNLKLCHTSIFMSRSALGIECNFLITFVLFHNFSHNYLHSQAFSCYNIKYSVRKNIMKYYNTISFRVWLYNFQMVFKKIKNLKILSIDWYAHPFTPKRLYEMSPNFLLIIFNFMKVYFISERKLILIIMIYKKR